MGLAEILSSVLSLSLTEKLEIVNYLLKGTGLKAISSTECENNYWASKIIALAQGIETNDRKIFIYAIASYLQKYCGEDKDVKLFLEKAIAIASKTKSQRNLQILAHQVHRQLSIDQKALEKLQDSSDGANFYLKFRCTKPNHLLRTAKQLAEIR